MIAHETQIRVRYADTDQMGYVYYGKYAEYFEVGRVELIRALGFTYRSIEERGIMMPVADMKIKYYQPGRYDELLSIKTMIVEFPRASFLTQYEVRNESGDLVVKGEVRLAFIDMERMRPTRAPGYIKEAIEAVWPEEAE